MIHEWFMWWFSDPVCLIFSGWIFGLGTGIILGRVWSTRKFEIERDEARYEAETIKAAYEMLKKDDAKGMSRDDRWLELPCPVCRCPKRDCRCKAVM